MDAPPDAEAEFDRIIRSAALPEGVRIDGIPNADWDRLTKPIMKVAFPDRRSLTREELFPQDVVDAAERVASLEGEGLLSHRYGFWKGDELIGFYQGQQLLYAAYGMYGTALVPEWQDKGIYSALLAKVIEGARATGFIKVVSRHFPDDNVMLAAKISRGFIVNGLVLTLNNGPLVELAYYLHEPATRR